MESQATAQHYFPNINELLEGMYQYQQQRAINFYGNYEYYHIECYEGLLLCQK